MGSPVVYDGEEVTTAEPSGQLRHRLVAFFGVTYAITWSAWGAAIVLGSGTSAGSILTLVGGVGPLVAAGLLSWRDGSLREWASRAVRWRVSVRWWVVAIAVPVVLSLASYAVYALATGTSLGLTSDPIYVVYLSVFLLVFFLRGGFGEEMGWRGYALPALLERHSALVSALVVYGTDLRSGHDGATEGPSVLEALDE